MFGRSLSFLSDTEAMARTGLTEHDFGHGKLIQSGHEKLIHPRAQFSTRSRAAMTAILVGRTKGRRRGDANNQA